MPALAAAAGDLAAPQDQQALCELRLANEALVAMLDRERGSCKAAQSKVQDLELQLQEVS